MPRLHPSYLKSISSRIFSKPKTIKSNDILKSWKIVRGDEVMVMTGKDKGKKGMVNKVLRDQNSIIVTNANVVYKHIPKTPTAPSGKVQKEMPIHVSNVALIDPSNGMPTKIVLRKYTDPETGKTEKRRYAVGTNTYIEKKKYLEYQNEWIDGEKDTEPESVTKVTFNATPGEAPFPPELMKEIANSRHKVI
ncbi:hypothetical protein H4219_002387 [Mycoemilia scoparia]|uniref:KOW domain-containing protein n=1 Tax=Mycoemilia scoparia TaxID=417184 RepID=A0A9W8DP57_9FUNG|nr:hypothetical protein H4219_002387 [Mycoemilia scoparia]